MPEPVYAHVKARSALRTTIVMPFGELGGGELWLLRLLDATSRLRPTALLLRDGPLRDEFERRGVEVAVIEVGRRPQDILSSWPAIQRRLLATEPEVVVGNGVKAQTAIMIPALRRRLPNVWVKHDHSFDKRLTPVLARMATEVVVTTEDLVGPTRRRHVTVIHPSRPSEAPLARHRAKREIARLAGPSHLDTLAMLTRLTPYKGVDTAIRALSLTGADRWRLVVFGGKDPAEPSEADRLRKLAEQLGVGDRVVLVGHVDGAARLLPGVEALAVLTGSGGPRTPGREGFGMSAMEAMLAGIPVIAPNDGGPVGARIQQGAGMLVNARDALSVREALRELTPPVRAALGEEARRRAETLFSTAPVAAERFVRVLGVAARRGDLLTGSPFIGGEAPA